MKIIKLLKTKFFIAFIFLTSIPALLPLFHKGFFPLQDFVFVVRIYENFRALRDFQFPVRWAADLRYGEPLFDFYAPLPYYLGSAVHFLMHLSYIDTSKVLMGSSLILSGIAMFFLAKELFGKWGGVIAAVLYMYAPYHSVDLYVRGALSESWALVFFPLIFLFIFKLKNNPTVKNLLFLSLSLSGLFITHNIMTVMFFPFIVGWIIFLFFEKRDGRSNIFLLKAFLAFLLAACISASYLLPAFFEKDLVQSLNLTNGYYDFRAHFVEIHQFFSTFWGYGPSVWGPEDGLSFQVGLVHWFLIGLLAVLTIAVKSFRKLYGGLLFILFVEFLFSLFMQHNKSTFIWTSFPLLSFIQFPWRFLGITIFTSSLLIGSLGYFFKEKFIFIGLAALLGIVFYYNQFAHPQFFYDKRTDEDYISGIFIKNEGFIPRDYVPVYVKKSLPDHQEQPWALSGSIKVVSFMPHSSWALAQIESTQSAKVIMPISYFPGWTVRENGKIIPQDKPGELGLVQVSLPKGSHTLNLNFDNTPIRSLGDGLSIFGLLVFAAGVIGLKRKGI